MKHTLFLFVPVIVMAGCGGSSGVSTSAANTPSSSLVSSLSSVATSSSISSSSISSATSSSALSSSSSTSIQVSSVSSVAPPAAPQGVNATVAGASQINLTWSAVTDATGYNIYSATTPDVVVTSANKRNVSINSGLSFSDLGLMASTTYYYKVTAIKNSIESAASVEISAKTSAVDLPSAISCNKTFFQANAPVRTPTSSELESFAGTYTGSEGDYDTNFTFVPSGVARLVFNANGTATYNGSTYSPTSYCYETLPNNAGAQLVIHADVSHFDLRAAGDWSGASPAGKSVSNTPYNGGTQGIGVTLSSPVEGFSSIPNSTQAMVDQTKNANTLVKKKGTWGDLTNSIGLVVGYTKQNNPMPGLYGNSAQIETLEVIVAKGIPVVSAPLDTQGYLCTLTADYPIAKCADKGIGFDLTSGVVTFKASPMKIVVGTASSFTITGSLNFTPF